MTVDSTTEVDVGMDMLVSLLVRLVLVRLGCCCYEIVGEVRKEK